MHNVKGKPLCKVHVTRSRLASEVSARCCVVDDCYITFADAKLIAEEFHAIRDECACVVAGDVPGGPCSAYFLVCHSAHLVSLCLGSLLRRLTVWIIQKKLHYLDDDENHARKGEDVDCRCDGDEMFVLLNHIFMP